MQKRMITAVVLGLFLAPSIAMAAWSGARCTLGIGYASWALNDDTDSDGIYDSAEDANQNCKHDNGELDFNSADTDGDGIQDDIEQSFGDEDGDGIGVLGDSDGDGTLNGVDLDSDNDNIPDQEEDKNGNGIVDQIGESSPYSKDTDADGIADNVEHPDCRNNDTIPCRYICDSTVNMENDPYLSKIDSDNDGLKDWQEDRNGNCEYLEVIAGVQETDPFIADTDGDGINDKNDLCPSDPSNECRGECEPGRNLVMTDPNRDTDHDGLKDWEEDWDDNCIVDPGETNPLLADTDADGLEDRFDCVTGPNQLSINPEQFEANTPTSDAEMDLAYLECQPSRIIPKLRDCDRDKIPDYLEDLDGDCDCGQTETCRFNPDTDGDGLLDGTEAGTDGVVGPKDTDPLLFDTDGDQIWDGDEDQNKNGRHDPYESDPRKTDTDFDGIPDNVEDQNLNGICDLELDANFVATGNTNSIEISCAWSADTDRDGLVDGAEDCFGGNGVVDEEEPDPRVRDTDGDGLIDGAEDKNSNCKLDDGETSPTSRTTYGQNDFSYSQRQRGINKGCGMDIVGGALPGMQALLLALSGYGIVTIRRRRKK